MDVLIAPVGDQDPFSWKNDLKGSVLTLVEHLQPDRVFLLPTQLPPGYAGNGENRETYSSAIKTREFLQQHEAFQNGDAITIVPLCVENATDYTQVLGALHGAALQIMSSLRDVETLRLHVSAASGTPAIKADMILLVSSGVLSREGMDPPRVYQVANPSIQPDNRVSTVDVTIIEAARLVDHACVLLRQEELDAACQDLKRLAEIAGSPARRALAATLDRYVAAHQLHEQLAYSRARQALSDLLGNATYRAQLDGIADLIRRQIATLQRLNNGDPVELYRDLLLNAEQRQRRGEYADALARCWRVAEGTLRERLRDKHDVDLDDDGHALKLDQVARIRHIDPKRTMLDGESRRLRRTLYASQLMKVLDALGDSSLNNALMKPLNPEMQKQVNGRLVEQLKSHDQRLSRELRSKLRLPALRNFNELAKTNTYRIRTYDDLAIWLNVVRNCSIVAHGHADVGKVDGEAAVALARQIVAAVVGAPERDHPFGPQAHEQTVQWARAALLRA